MLKLIRFSIFYPVIFSLHLLIHIYDTAFNKIKKVRGAQIIITPLLFEKAISKTLDYNAYAASPYIYTKNKILRITLNGVMFGEMPRNVYDFVVSYVVYVCEGAPPVGAAALTSVEQIIAKDKATCEKLLDDLFDWIQKYGTAIRYQNRFIASDSSKEFLAEMLKLHDTLFEKISYMDEF